MATLCLSGSAIVKAGVNVGAVPPDSWDVFIEEAEAHLAAITKYDVVTNWGATLSGSSMAGILSEYCARAAAIQGITYDMSVYTTRIEAEDMINVHWARNQEIQNILRKQDIQDFAGT